MSLERPGFIIVAALFALGCAENAILELVITLPASPDTATWYGVIDVNRATEAGFGLPHEGAGLSPTPLVLTDQPQVDCISVQSHDDAMDLEIRVRFCHSDSCSILPDDADPPGRYFRLEHPFYIGHRTFWYRVIEDVPRCAVDADCEAGRCISGSCACATDADCCAGGCRCPTGSDPAGGTCYTCEDGPDMEVPGESPTPDSCVQTVNRCHIEGCTSERGATNFCLLREPMEHFCERPNATDVVQDYPPACLAE